MLLAAGLATVITVTQVSGVTISETNRGYTDVPCQGDRRVIVHLFEWPWDDIADECESYLGPKVQGEHDHQLTNMYNLGLLWSAGISTHGAHSWICLVDKIPACVIQT